MNNPILETKNLSIQYVTKDLGTCYAVNDVNIQLQKSHTLGIVGETGAGKTTLAKGITGCYRSLKGGCLMERSFLMAKTNIRNRNMK